jgi:multidrug efflux system membrane fusion protein
VDFVSNMVSNQSGSIELRASFPNGDLSLVPGQLVNVTVELNDIPEALVLPRDAVNDSPGGSFVFVVKNGKAIQTPVEILTDDGTNVAISGKGVTPGDVVVVEGQLRVTPGGAVRQLGQPQGATGGASQSHRKRTPHR